MTATMQKPSDAPARGGGEPIMLAPGEGHAVHPLGMDMSVKARGAQTGGGLTVIEWTGRSGEKAPPAVHADDDEAFYVLEGEFTIQVGERKLRATAGSFAYVPRGTLHNISCEGDQPGRVLMIFTPGRMDRFFQEIAALPPGPPDFAKLIGISARYGTSHPTAPSH
jgi:quercetin dioxygenase-like cupin family protein